MQLAIGGLLAKIGRVSIVGVLMWFCLEAGANESVFSELDCAGQQGFELEYSPRVGPRESHR